MLKEGDIIELKDGHTVYAMVPEHFFFSNRKGSFKLTKHEVTIGGEFEYLAGRYVVYKTVFGGGGTGHGPHDVFPDGHHVYCEKLDDRDIKVDFYQSGCFTAMITDIEPVGRAQRQWVEESDGDCKEDPASTSAEPDHSIFAGDPPESLGLDQEAGTSASLEDPLGYEITVGHSIEVVDVGEGSGKITSVTDGKEHHEGTDLF